MPPDHKPVFGIPKYGLLERASCQNRFRWLFSCSLPIQYNGVWGGKREREMALKRICWSAKFLFAPVLLVFACTSLLSAQNGLPVTVTMKSNHSFEGRIDSVAGFSSIRVPPGSGKVAYVIDDGLRRVYVSKHHIVNEDPVPLKISEIEFPIWQDAIERSSSLPRGAFFGASPFNEYGHRVITVDVGRKNGPKNYVQAITKITPRFIELNSLRAKGPKTALTMSIGRGAVSPQVIRNLLENQIAKSNSPAEYESIFTYYLQSQQFGEALTQLDLIGRRFPEREERIEQLRQRVVQSEARQVLREIQRRVDNGQTILARQLGGKNMNTEGVAPQNLMQLASIKEELDAADKKVADVQQKVIELIKSYRNNPTAKITADQETMLGRFLTELETELSPTNVARMDSYLVQASDAAQKDQEKVALAISGWVLGSNNATPNFALAQSLFQVRDLVTSYLGTGDPAAHQEILKKLRDFDTSNPKTIASMLAQMKPPEHEAALEGYTGEKPIEFDVTVPGTNARPEEQKFQVKVHLPVQYDPYRPYPLLLTLPNTGMAAEKQLSMFHGNYIKNVGVGRVGRASRNGVIVASVQWAKPGQTACLYSRREHATVLRAMRACFRKFQINTDQVFLYGQGVGANLAYDIGLAHPEHFAGVIPVGGHIEKFAKIHATRDRNVPLSIYAVFGEADRQTQLKNLQIWNSMLFSARSSNLILVEYIGRLANETFPDDIESMFSWMQFQRRRRPDRAGFEFSVESLRPWDNYYWFIELDGFPRMNVMWPEMWTDGKLKPLTIKGELKPEGEVNHFVVKPAKAGRSMTLWLSDEFVNFEKEVKITGRGRKFEEAVTPSTQVMLEDARTRCDRLHPYWARLDCIDGKWQPAE